MKNKTFKIRIICSEHDGEWFWCVCGRQTDGYGKCHNVDCKFNK